MHRIMIKKELQVTIILILNLLENGLKCYRKCGTLQRNKKSKLLCHIKKENFSNILIFLEKHLNIILLCDLM